MTNKYFIYGLVDPRDDKVKYIGKSCQGMVTPRRHTEPSRLRVKTLKTSWIKGLLKKNLKPKIEILQICSSKEETSTVEIATIKSYLNKGYKLKNGTKGGDGGCTGGGLKKKQILAKCLQTGKTKKYISITEMQKDDFSPNHVIQVCKGKRWSHKGYRFTYLGQPFAKRINGRVHPVTAICRKSNKIILFKSVKECAAYFGKDSSMISHICAGRVNQLKHFTLYYTKKD